MIQKVSVITEREATVPRHTQARTHTQKHVCKTGAHLSATQENSITVHTASKIRQILLLQAFLCHTILR